MSYFSKFPLITYELNNNESVVKDILRRCTFISEYKPYSDLYTQYTIHEGDTPQSLAIKFYKSPYYHWVILMFNEIHNVYFDWPLDQFTLEEMCRKRYGVSNMYKTKHYEVDGIVVGEVKEFSEDVEWVEPVFTGLATAVSFYDYEIQLNEAKRNIAILRPELLASFVNQFESSINV